MKQHAKWITTVLAVAGCLAIANPMQAQTQLISDFSGITLNPTYGNWNLDGSEVINGGTGYAPTLTSVPSFRVNAKGYGSGHYEIPVGNQQLLNTGISQVTLSLTLNSPSVSTAWLGVKFLLNDNQGNSDVWYGAYTGLWGVDNGSWANGNVGTAVWTGNSLTMTVPLTGPMLAAVQTGNDKITGFNLVLDPAYFSEGNGVYDITYNSLTVSAVPEPTTVALLTLGGFGLAIARRRVRVN
jgi:hypothetical protein